MGQILPKISFSPSLMCMNLLDVRYQIEILNTRYDMLHVDIMDGHFAQSLHLSPDFVRAIREISTLPIDVHLMVETPNMFIDDLLEAGADIVSLHVETIGREAFRIIRKIKEYGKRVGIALCPATSLSSLENLLDYADMITILNVDIGYTGQPIIENMLMKTRELKKIREEKQYHYLIQSDGGVRKETYQALFQSGTEVFVIGKAALFGKHSNLNIACDKMESECIAILADN